MSAALAIAAKRSIVLHAFHNFVRRQDTWKRTVEQVPIGRGDEFDDADAQQVQDATEIRLLGPAQVELEYVLWRWPYEKKG